jgi:hypothetical protein
MPEDQEPRADVEDTIVATPGMSVDILCPGCRGIIITISSGTSDEEKLHQELWRMTHPEAPTDNTTNR